MNEGQLAETHEPQNVQVDIDAGIPEETAVIRLRDEAGVFLEINMPDERELSTSEGGPPVRLVSRRCWARRRPRGSWKSKPL